MTLDREKYVARTLIILKAIFIPIVVGVTGTLIAELSSTSCLEVECVQSVVAGSAITDVTIDIVDCTVCRLEASFGFPREPKIKAIEPFHFRQYREWDSSTSQLVLRLPVDLELGEGTRIWFRISSDGAGVSDMMNLHKSVTALRKIQAVGKRNFFSRHILSSTGLVTLFFILLIFLIITPTEKWYLRTKEIAPNPPQVEPLNTLRAPNDNRRKP